MHFPAHIEKVIHRNYTFNFGEYINRGFETVQKNLGLFIGFLLIYMMINGMFEAVADMMGYYPGTAFNILFSVVIEPCLIAGAYLAAHKSTENDNLRFDDFFKGFDKIKPLAISALIQTSLYLVFLSPLFIFGDANLTHLTSGTLPFDYLTDNLMNLGILYFIALLPVIYLSIAWSFAPFLIIFHEMEAVPALEASRRIITKKWFVFAGFFFVIILIAILGVLGFIIGILFTVPAAVCMLYAAFRDVVGMPNEEEDDILDHLIMV